MPSCKDGVVTDDGSGIGPCEHTYKEPILIVTSIHDELNNQFIRFVKLRDLKINGYPQNGNLNTFVSNSVVSDGSIYYCNVPFGIGNTEGKYEFVIEAEGYQPKMVAIDNVKYSVIKGGCPSYNDGGKRIELTLSR